jgi:hypothetical protein
VVARAISASNLSRSQSNPARPSSSDTRTMALPAWMPEWTVHPLTVRQFTLLQRDSLPGCRGGQFTLLHVTVHPLQCDSSPSTVRQFTLLQCDSSPSYSATVHPPTVRQFTLHSATVHPLAVRQFTLLQCDSSPSTVRQFTLRSATVHPLAVRQFTLLQCDSSPSCSATVYLDGVVDLGDAERPEEHALRQREQQVVLREATPLWKLKCSAEHSILN